MALSMKRRLQQIAANQSEYQEHYPTLNFPPETELEQARQQRAQVLAHLAERVEFGCGGTKLDMRKLSPGCRICTEGGWSCLFISGRCNCDCFYCPTSQQQLGLPATNSVEFRHPDDYVAYLKRFGFTGASISGGEPLLTPQRTLAFVRAIKRYFGQGMHLWLYTNGTLLNNELAAQLCDAGLDEIRFDIGATDYNLGTLKHAGGIFPTLTVEIPAIPAEVPRLKELLGALQDRGVQHLNLHQLRLTPHNLPQLQQRNLRYLHGDKVTVLDSELAALEILRHVIDTGIDLPVNYCSFVYKNRFQAEAARKRNAPLLIKSCEALSESGFIRSLRLCGEKSAIDRQLETFVREAVNPDFFKLERKGEALCFHPALWPRIALDDFTLSIAYGGARQLSRLSYRNPFVSIELSKRLTLVVERSRVSEDFELDAQQAELFGQVFLLGFKMETALPATDLWDEILSFERTREGLQDYF